MDFLQELEEVLKQSRADFAFIRQSRPILSVADAKAYYEIEKAAPVLILQSEQGLIAVIVSGNRGRIDFKALKEKFGFSKLKMADKGKILRQTGYEIGKIPLIGHCLACIFDDSLLTFDYIYGGTGHELITLKIKPEDVKRLNNVIGTL